MQKRYLLTPGPTSVPSEVLLTMSQPIIHHRTKEYRKIFAKVNEGLKYLFQTASDVLIFSSSGTGAMEGAVSNLLSPNDRALVVKGGKFGERFAEICTAYGVEVIPVDVVWGEAVEPKEIESKLAENPDIKAVFTTLCETSTGVVNDIESIGNIVAKHSAALVVDAISGLGAMEYKPDLWHVDVTVGCSQKGLMLPPGLSFISLSEKGWKLVAESQLPKYYFSFLKARKGIGSLESPFTPAISLIIGLNEALQMIREEGIESVWRRHSRLAAAVRAAVRALRLELFAPRTAADAVTAVKVPSEIDGVLLVKKMSEKYGMTIAGGQDHLKGKIFRIATLGYADTFDVISVLAALTMTLSELGYEVELGAAVRAAEEILMK
ncbi:alanine--glyoxylate aminotransferase family protein [candidate division NPL-UPA2 bacterium Unc8]|uniref:Alanine--glyoxylate aminotransferase family protein n=1 Tax=candidate division NPL-UPA2 bacterium Unc8 TaxID=1980939 RepID=A0A399FXZ1_UNCN2|nr:Serine-pyruvate aminotransferase [Bacillota bacterium]MBT9138112.1 Serine-pyruvate aminotransferase [Bacillota bacterium]MBT9146737.1 Serine-pyruvate aminotransferase [Bacillota bacterium]RII00063.1 MAG: alanine--glyoxylate aminotransferase family protein [candidate division NPL-UPA2 bacterium Unc8]